MDIREARGLLLAYATEINICVCCFLREAEEGKRRCAKCNERNRLSAKKQRSNPLNCSRCGQKKTDTHNCNKNK